MASFLSRLLLIYAHSGVWGPQTRALTMEILWEVLLGGASASLQMLVWKLFWLGRCVLTWILWTWCGHVLAVRTGEDIPSGLDDLWLRISSEDRPLPRPLERSVSENLKKKSVFGTIVLAPGREFSTGSCQRGVRGHPCEICSKQTCNINEWKMTPDVCLSQTLLSLETWW